MICPTCKTIHHTCPKCGKESAERHWNKKSIRCRCFCGHQWHEDMKGNVIKIQYGRPRLVG